MESARIALTEGVRGVAFRTHVQQVEGSPWHTIRDTRLYEDGVDTFRAIADAVDSATREILLEIYILRDDRVGKSLHERLTNAAMRGVQVYVLADAIGSIGTSRRYWRALRDAGIQVRLFHPLWASPVQNWRRDHRKILVVDRTVAFTGGMNIGDEYGSALGTTGAAFRDTFMQMSGSIVEELASVFAEGWQRAGGADIPGITPLRTLLRMPTAVPEGPAALVLDGHPERGQPETIAVFTAIAKAVQARWWITTPYFAPPDAALRMLTDAASRGVDVRLLLPGKTDVPLLRHAARATYGELLRGGVRVFEYTRHVLHAKTMVCDGHLSVVGSSNLDFRSLWFNAECNVLIADDAVARELEAQFRVDQAHSTEMQLGEWLGRGVFERAGDRLARAVRALL